MSESAGSMAYPRSDDRSAHNELIMVRKGGPAMANLGWLQRSGGRRQRGISNARIVLAVLALTGLGMIGPATSATAGALADGPEPPPTCFPHPCSAAALVLPAPPGMVLAQPESTV
jgi:hypothetical protein